MTPIMICRASEVSALDRAVIQDDGVPESTLMENAGGALAEVARREFGATDLHYFIACGLGNNGGDGLVAARRLATGGAKVSVLLMGERSGLSAASGEPLRLAEVCGVAIHCLPDGIDWKSILRSSDVIIDAVFGTGLSRDITGRLSEVISAINESSQPVVACDIPSGIDGTTGRKRGCAINADHTVSFGLVKLGNLINEGIAAGGALHIASISYPPKRLRECASDLALNLPAPLPARDPNGYKGSHGEALLVAGAASYFGAPYFAAAAFLSSGGGYARLCLPKSIAGTVAGLVPEAVLHPQIEDEHGAMTMSSEEELLGLSNGSNAVVLGPGLSLHLGAQSLVRALTAKVQSPLILDGDALTVLASSLELIEERSARGWMTVLTPHPGEMARLSGLTTEVITQDPVTCAQTLAQRLKCYLILKSARTVIATPGGKAWLNITGNSGLGTPGTGDVLTGLIATRWAQIRDATDDAYSMALRQAVFIHGLAGDLAAQDMGEDGVTASCLLEYLAKATQRFRKDHRQLMAASGYGPNLL